MKQPAQCHLQQKENLTNEDINVKNNFELLHTFEDESHLWRYLLKCKDCGQLYFYEFYEEIDWKEGNDPQYRTFIPIESKEEAENMAKMKSFELLKISPRLQYDWPANADKSKIYWIRK